MSDDKKFVGEDFLKKLREQAARRDQIAAEVGVLRIHYLNAERDAQIRIERSVHEQAGLGAEALRSVGVDPEQANYAIDLATGEVKAP